jgi:hypothetical protein
MTINRNIITRAFYLLGFFIGCLILPVVLRLALSVRRFVLTHRSLLTQPADFQYSLERRLRSSSSGHARVRDMRQSTQQQ